MNGIPKNCFNCGAPIEWDGSSSYIRCGFCAKKTFLKNESYKSFSHHNKKLNNYRKIIFNKKILISLIIAIPIALYTIPKFKSPELQETPAKLEGESISSKSQNTEVISTYQTSGEFKLLKERDYAGAIEDFSKIIRIDPNHMMAYYLRGSAKSLAEDYKGAIKDLSIAIKIDASYHFSYNSRAFAKQYSKDYRGALEDLFISLGIEPESSNTNHSIGLIKYKLKDYEGAIKYLSRAINLDPKRADSYFYVGEIKYKWKDYDSAIKYYSKAIYFDPKYVLPYIQIGRAKLKISDIDGACSIWREGLLIAEGSILKKWIVKDINKTCRD